MGESRYDRALTVFSPDGHLFQVEYAVEAVKKGITVLGVKGSESVVLAVEKKTIQKLQELRTVRKIVQIDSHIMLGFAGLQAAIDYVHLDARVLIDTARVQCQSHRLQFDEPPKVEHIARFIARKQQKYTQSHGVRPYGVCLIVCGRDLDGTTHVYQCDPSGMYSEWKACATGRSGKTVQEYMEKHYKELEKLETEGGEGGNTGHGQSDAAAIRSSLKAMTEVVDSGRSIEVAVLGVDGMKILDDETVDEIAKSVIAEKEEEKERERKEKKEKPEK